MLCVIVQRFCFPCFPFLPEHPFDGVGEVADGGF